MNLEAYARTDAGPARETNEDSMLVDLENQLFIIADGMGGCASGEVAKAVLDILAADEEQVETRLN